MNKDIKRKAEEQKKKKKDRKHMRQQPLVIAWYYSHDAQDDLPAPQAVPAIILHYTTRYTSPIAELQGSSKCFAKVQRPRQRPVIALLGKWTASFASVGKEGQ